MKCTCNDKTHLLGRCPVCIEKPARGSDSPGFALLTALIKDMEEQINDCKTGGEFANDKSWNLEEGVLLSWGDAEKIINLIKGS